MLIFVLKYSSKSCVTVASLMIESDQKNIYYVHKNGDV